MKRLSATLALVFILCCGAASANVLGDMRHAPDIDTTAYAPLDAFFEYYYLTKPTDDIGQFLRDLDASGMAENFPSTQAPLAAFIASVFAANPDKAEAWRKPVEPYGDTLQAIIDDAAAPGLTEPVLAAEDIDRLWAAFMASGDVAYISRIADAACGAQDAEGRLPLPDMQIKRQASAELYEYAKAHEIALRLLQMRKDDKKGACRDGKTAALIPPPLPMMQMDGPFGAALLATEKETLEAQQTRTVADILALPPVTKVKPGEDIGIVIAFSGMDLDESQHASLTVDFHIEGPNGKALQTEDAALQLLDSQLYAGRYVLNRLATPLSHRFSKSDTPGVYTFDVRLKDNLGNHELHLRQTVELLKAD